MSFRARVRRRNFLLALLAGPLSASACYYAGWRVETAPVRAVVDSLPPDTPLRVCKSATDTVALWYPRIVQDTLIGSGVELPKARQDPAAAADDSAWARRSSWMRIPVSSISCTGRRVEGVRVGPTIALAFALVLLAGAADLLSGGLKLFHH